jgi:spore germination cell wall hydrolase CwlJ-like protein
LPAGLEPTVKALGQAALPLGLLCVGAALGGASLGQQVKPLLAASLFKFLVMPLTTWGLCRLLGLSGQAAVVAVLFQALPTASSSYVMARQMGGNAPLMATIIALQTVAAAPPAFGANAELNRPARLKSAHLECAHAPSWMLIGLTSALLAGPSPPPTARRPPSPKTRPQVLEEKVVEDAPPPKKPRNITPTETQAVDPAGQAPMDDSITCLARTIYWEAKGADSET